MLKKPRRLLLVRSKASPTPRTSRSTSVAKSKEGACLADSDSHIYMPQSVDQYSDSNYISIRH